MTQIQNTSFLRQWAPLTGLFDKLPTRTPGIFSQDIKLTCIDVVSEFLVIGTNAGIIFWYDRNRKTLQQLRCENNNAPISFVKAVSTVDYMVASGNHSGSITIFQIPKSYPDALPDSLKPQQKQVERYTVTDLHKSPITSLEWSKNGMNLFSGDKSGSIVLTEIDFYMHVCKSIEILDESYEVVQLSYRQRHLLVSTTYRTIICHHAEKWKVCQVGKKDRKVLGNFGGLIYQKGFKPNDIILYCMRPGLRIWIADAEGNVQKTLLFKDLLRKDCAQVPLLNPISKTLQQLKPQKEATFGVVQQFCDCLLITYSSDIVYILDPSNMSILATVNNLRSILDVATYMDELFILEEDRSLLRIAYRPEFDGDEINISVDTVVSNAEEAQEWPIADCRTFAEISKEQFEDSILFRYTNKLKRKPYKESTSDSKIKMTNIVDTDDVSFTRPTLMNLSAVGILPDLRSPESIVNDIEYKERILADVLNLDKLKLDQEDVIEDKANITYKPELPCQSCHTNFLAEYSTHKMETQLVGENSNGKATKNTFQVVNVPNDWNISNIQFSNNETDGEDRRRQTDPIPIVRTESQSSRQSNDSSLSDWEIV